MSISFPTNLDTLTNPSSTDNTSTVSHADQHSNANDAIEALEAKVGKDASAVTTSHDYKLSEVTSTDKAVGKTASQTLTNKTLTTPVIASIKPSAGNTLTLPDVTDTVITQTSPAITTPKITTSINDANGNEVIKTPATSSAVNEITITNAATGNDVLVSATGGDENIGLKVKAKGTSKVKIGTAELQFPNADGSSNQILKTDGGGVLSWTDASTSSSKFGGTGADGALSVSSGTTNIDLGGAQVFIKNYSTISITGTGKITFSNPHASGSMVILKASSDVTITSSTNPAIDVRLIGANLATAGWSTFANPGAGTDGSGATAGTGGSGIALFTSNLVPKNIPILVGSGSGTGGTGIGGPNPGDGGAGKRGGGCLYIECAGALNISSTLNASGTTGENGESTGAGGGGGGGGGSGAGSIIILYNTLTSNTGTYSVAAGSGGTGGTGLGGSYTSGGGGGGGGSKSAGSNGVNGSTGTNVNGGDGGAGGAGFSLIALNTEF